MQRCTFCVFYQIVFLTFFFCNSTLYYHIMNIRLGLKGQGHIIFGQGHKCFDYVLSYCIFDLTAFKVLLKIFIYKSLHFTFVYRFCWVTMEMMGERKIILVLLKKITNMLLNCLVNVIKTALCMKCDICTSTIGCKYEASNTWSNMQIVINAQKKLLVI